MNTFCKVFRIFIFLFIFALILFPFFAYDANADEITTVQLPLKQIQAEPTPPVGESDNPFDQSRWTYINLADEVNCMALNLYFEARGQSTKGQIAVGLVTINRVLSKKYPNSICDVVWQQNKNRKGKLVAQFSWTLDGLHDNPQESKAWEESKMIAESMLAEGSLFNMGDLTNGSTHYHAFYVTPFWSKHLTQTIVVGDHLFYTNSPVAKVSSSKL